MADEKDIDLQKELIQLLETQRSKEEEIGKQRLRLFEKQEDERKKEAEAAIKNLKQLENELQTKKDISELDKTILEAKIAAARTELKIRTDNLQKLEKQIKIQKDLNKAADDAPDYIKGFFSGKGGDMISKSAGQMGGTIEKHLTGKLKNAIMGADSFRGAMRAAVGPAAALAIFAFTAAIVKLAIQLHDAEGAFMATTGASRDFAHSLSESYDETREFGASIEQTSKAMTSLFMNFTDFTMQNEKTRESLTKTATVLSKMGVSTDDFAKGIQNLTKAMGFNAESAAQQLLNLEKFAEELGVAPSKIAADFAGAGGSLAKFGDQGVQAFKRLEIASKITGMEMQRILTLTEKFDTFEGAATMAGKLNAALGGNFVNAMDLMMETDPVGRFEQIRDAILRTGMSFDDMTYFQKNMYKEMLGLQDVGELALLLSGRTDLMSQSFSQSAQSYEEAAERAKEIASFQEKLNILFADMIPILTPLIDVMSNMFETLGFFAEGYSEAIDFVNQFEGALTSLVVVLTIAAAALAVYLAPFLVIPIAIAGVIAAIGALLNIMFHKRNSPTFFEGLTMMGEDILPSVEQGFTGTATAVQATTAQIDRSPVSAVADSGTGGTSTQTVQQPVNITLNGEVVGKFVMETLGTAIKNISILQ